MACQGSLAAACSADPSPPIDRPLAASATRLEGATLDRFANDERIERVTARVAEIDRARGAVLASDVDATVFDRAQRPRARIQSPFASGTTRTSTIIFSQGVRIADGDGRTMTTETLSYDAARGTAASSSTARVEGANFSVTGARLRADLRDGWVELDGPVVAKLTRIR